MYCFDTVKNIYIFTTKLKSLIRCLCMCGSNKVLFVFRRNDAFPNFFQKLFR